MARFTDATLARMLELIDYYHVLQVDPVAEPEVIRAAFRALATKYHPDVEGGNAERMTALNRAWNVLGHPEKRAAYDRSRVALSPRRSAAAARPGDPQPADPARPDDADLLRPRPWPGAASRATQPSGTVLDFGRYAGWSFGEIARHDPDFLRWLARMPIGRPYAAEIERILGSLRPSAPEPARPEPKRRFGLR